MDTSSGGQSDWLRPAAASAGEGGCIWAGLDDSAAEARRDLLPRAWEGRGRAGRARVE